MKLAHALIGFLGVFALSACTTGAAPSTSAPASITLTRTVCFGFCPAYTVTIAGDGQVTYVGRNFVNVIGEQHARISQEAVEALMQRFDAIGFDGLREEYRAAVTDLPTYTLVLERNGSRKTVVDYGGLSAGMPQGVRDLQNEVDRVAGVSRWTLRDGQPVRGPAPER